MRDFNKIFIIGLSRTGTRSLTLALHKLGIDVCHHLKSTRGTDMAIAGRVSEIPELEYYRGLSDLPAAMNYKELDEAFPNSLFIFPIRKKSSWLNSCKKHYRKDQGPLFLNCYGVSSFDKDIFDEVYSKHRDGVFRYFHHSDSLLPMYMPGDFTWEIICDYLWVEEPDEEFPRITHSRKDKVYKPIKDLRKRITDEINTRYSD